MNKLILSVVLVALVGCAQALEFGKCPDVKVVDNFDASRYLGIWYEAKSFGNFFEFAFVRCPKANYTATDDPKTITVQNSGYRRLIGGIDYVTGKGTAVDNAKFVIEFPKLFGRHSSAPYWVLDTDYDNYAIVWACTEKLGFLRDESSWILVRERSDTIKPEILEKVQAVLDANKIETSRYRTIKQEGCQN